MVGTHAPVDAFLGGRGHKGSLMEAEVAQAWARLWKYPHVLGRARVRKYHKKITSQFLLLRNVARAPEPRVVPTTISRLIHPRRAAQRVVVRAVDGVDEGAAP